MISYILIILLLVCILIYIIHELRFRRRVMEILSTSPYTADIPATAHGYRQKILAYLLFFENTLEKHYELVILKKNAELSSLQRQIDPHFLYNSLDSIRGKAYEQNVPQIADMINCLSMQFRYTIGQFDVPVTIENEIRHCENFLKIQRYRFDSQYEIQVNAEDARLLLCKVPKLTFQPIIENSVKYGFRERRCNNLIEIRIIETAQDLVVQLKDNGCGMNLEKLKELNQQLFQGIDVPSANPYAEHIALRNINSRLKLMYGPRYGLSVYSMENAGTTVELLIPKGASSNENRETTVG